MDTRTRGAAAEYAAFTCVARNPLRVAIHCPKPIGHGRATWAGDAAVAGRPQTVDDRTGRTECHLEPSRLQTFDRRVTSPRLRLPIMAGADDLQLVVGMNAWISDGPHAS